MALWLQDMYLWLRFSPEVARLFTRVQGLDRPEKSSVLTDKKVDDTYNVLRKPEGKNANGTPNTGQQVTVIVQENLKLAALLFHCSCRSMRRHSVIASRTEEA